MGIGIGGISNRIVIKNRDGSTAGSISFAKPASKKVKRLNYNFKSMSSQILLAKTSNAASKAITKARGTIAMLMRRMNTGDYDDEELEMAVKHARKMERIAKKRMLHLKKEEEIEQKGHSEESEEELLVTDEEDEEEEGAAVDEAFSDEEMEQMMQEYQQMMQQSMDELAQQAGLDKLAEELTEVTQETEPEDLERMKKRHRSDELRELAEADMKYLRAFFNKLQKEKESLSSTLNNLSGVAFQLSGLDMPVDMPEAPIMESGGNVDLSL